MKPTIVTCIYLNLQKSPLGGSLRYPIAFIYSLKSIAKCGYTIYCFTSKNDIEYLKKELPEKNIIFKISELEDSVYHEKINKAKNNTKTRIDKLRCYELVFNKIHWVEEIYNEYSEIDSIIWVDAGLSNRNLFPKKFFDVYHAKDFTIEHFECNLFSKELFDNINKIIEDKMYFIFTPNPQHQTNLFKDYDIRKNLIAGLFGFNRSNFNFFINEYETLVNEILEDNIMTMEEIIYSIIYQKNRDKFHLDEFNGWHHIDNLIGHPSETSKPFYKILENLVYEKQ